MEKENFYDLIEEGYDYYSLKEGNNIQKFWHKYKFKEVIDRIKDNSKILDIGCGSGALLTLLPKNQKLIIGLDISKNQIRFAKKLLGNNFFIVGKAQNLPFKKGSFDYIFLIEVLEHIDPKEGTNILKNIKELLNDGGKLILTTPNYLSLWPIIEVIWSKINPINYKEQHINKQNILKFKKNLNVLKFSNIRIKTFFIISPFLCMFFPEKLARRIFRLEKKLLPWFGSLIIAELKK